MSLGIEYMKMQRRATDLLVGDDAAWGRFLGCVDVQLNPRNTKDECLEQSVDHMNDLSCFQSDCRKNQASVGANNSLIFSSMSLALSGPLPTRINAILPF